MLYEYEIARLRPEEKDAILDAMLGMAAIDEQWQPEEVEFLKVYAAQFTDQDVEKLIAEYELDMERVGRKIAHSDLGPTGRSVLLKSLILVAAAAEGIDDSELAFYQQCARAFGIPEPRRIRLEKEVHRQVYAQMLKDAYRAAEITDEIREQLEHARSRLSIDDAAAEELENRVRQEMLPESE